MVRASHEYSEGFGFKSQLDPGGVFCHEFISHSLNENVIIHVYCVCVGWRCGGGEGGGGRSGGGEVSGDLP